MQQELHKCPSLFTTTKANVAVMVRMSSDASRLAVWAATQDGKSFKKEFAEDQIAQVKDRTKPTPWDKFFEELQGAFNRGAVECADGINVDFPTSGDASVKVRLALDPTTEDAQKAIMDGLLLYHFVHANTKDAERQLEEAMRKEFELRTMSADLEKEEQQLNSIIEHSKTQDKVNKQHLEELRAELMKLEAEHKGDPSMDEDEESITCRARNPLFDKTHKDYDTELLRLVKSKWTSAEQPPNPIIRPYTASELMQHTQNWTSQQRQDLWECLKKIEDWDYDVFKVQQLMSGDDHYSLATQPRGGSLFVTMYALLFRHNLLAHFKLDEQILLNWLSMVEAGYHGNPYHNSMHAADVLQITNYLLTKGGLIEKCKLTPEDILAALFAASIHDFDHPGINNSFLMRANTHLATLYNDRSVLENRHVSSVFELMKLSKFNILACLTEDQRRDIHDTVVEMVLATDMGLHTRYVQQWKRRIGENHELVKRDDQRLALAMALKMADISNCGRPHHIYMKWGAKISDEFYMQGDRERNFGLPCSPFMDRQQPAMARGQISFMNFVVLPMFESISEFLPNMHFSVEQTEANKTYWNNNPDE